MNESPFRPAAPEPAGKFRLKHPWRHADRATNPPFSRPMPDSRIQSLAKRIAGLRPIERSKRAALLEELRQVRSEIDPRASSEQMQRLDAALLLLEFMDRSEEVATAHTLQVAAGVLGSVDERALPLSARRGPRPLTSTPAEVDQHADLRLTEGLLLGSILLHAGVVSQEMLDRALRLHASNGAALGQCLMQLGAVTPAQISAAIAMQERMREPDRGEHREPDRGEHREPERGEHREPERGEHREPGDVPGPAHSKIDLRLSSKHAGFVSSFQNQVLGEILIRQGAITRQQLEYALQVQRAANVHIGEALVETGATTWELIKRGLEIQKKLRRSSA